MVKKEYFLWGLGGFATVSVLGTFLHFLYELSGGKLWSAVVSGVNESTWEHMKLLFFPMLFYAVAEYFFFGSRRDFWSIQLKSILLGQILIPVLFYTYNGVIGKSPDWVNISIFFIAAFFAYRNQVKTLKKENAAYFSPAFSLTTILVMALLFGIFTFFPPKLELFLDPVNGTRGI